MQKLTMKTKIGYGLGDFGTNIVLNATTIYLLYFFTDVFGISAAFAGAVFLVAKLWNAAIDPFIGHMTDHTDTRWGKKRPYILFGAIPFGIAFYILFAQPHLGVTGRSVYALISFLLFCTMVAMVNIPYASLTATMTRDSHERSVLSGFRMTFAIVGTLVAAVSVKPLVKLFPTEAAGFRGVGVIFGCIVAVMMIITFFTSFEKKADRDEVRGTFAENFKGMMNNGPFLLLVISLVMCTVSNYLIMSTVNYYFKYVLKAEGMISIAFLALFVTAVLAVPLWLACARRFSKRIAFMSGTIFVIIVLAALFLVKNPSPKVIIALLVFAGAGSSTFFLFPWAMIPDTVEYSEWKSGLTQEGFLYGFFLFGLKLAQALSGFIGGFALDFFGYVPNIEQTVQTKFGITFIMTIFPAVFLCIGLLCLFFYPISPEKHKKMLAEIEVRRKG